MESDATQHQIDETAVATLKILQNCALRMVGKKEKDALRKIFYDADTVDAFGQAAVPLIQQLSDIISEEQWKELWTSFNSGKSGSPLRLPPMAALVSDLQRIFSDNETTNDVPILTASTSSYGTQSNQVLEGIKKCFIPDPVVVQPKACAPPKPQVSKHTRSQPPSGMSGDLVRILIGEQFVSADGSEPAWEVFIPAVEALLVGDSSEEELQSGVILSVHREIDWLID